MDPANPAAGYEWPLIAAHMQQDEAHARARALVDQLSIDTPESLVDALHNLAVLADEENEDEVNVGLIALAHSDAVDAVAAAMDAHPVLDWRIYDEFLSNVHYDGIRLLAKCTTADSWHEHAASRAAAAKLKAAVHRADGSRLAYQALQAFPTSLTIARNACTVLANDPGVHNHDWWVHNEVVRTMLLALRRCMLLWSGQASAAELRSISWLEDADKSFSAESLESLIPRRVRDDDLRELALTVLPVLEDAAGCDATIMGPLITEGGVEMLVAIAHMCDDDERVFAETMDHLIILWNSYHDEPPDANGGERPPGWQPTFAQGEPRERVQAALRAHPAVAAWTLAVTNEMLGHSIGTGWNEASWNEQAPWFDRRSIPRHRMPMVDYANCLLSVQNAAIAQVPNAAVGRYRRQLGNALRLVTHRRNVVLPEDIVSLIVSSVVCADLGLEDV